MTWGPPLEAYARMALAGHSVHDTVTLRLHYGGWCPTEEVRLGEHAPEQAAARPAERRTA